MDAVSSLSTELQSAEGKLAAAVTDTGTVGDIAAARALPRDDRSAALQPQIAAAETALATAQANFGDSVANLGTLSEANAVLETVLVGVRDEQAAVKQALALQSSDPVTALTHVRQADQRAATAYELAQRDVSQFSAGGSSGSGTGGLGGLGGFGGGGSAGGELHGGIIGGLLRRQLGFTIVVIGPEPVVGRRVVGRQFWVEQLTVRRISLGRQQSFWRNFWSQWLRSQSRR
jgi:hypothetical protein